MISEEGSTRSLKARARRLDRRPRYKKLTATSGRLCVCVGRVGDDVGYVEKAAEGFGVWDNAAGVEVQWSSRAGSVEMWRRTRGGGRPGRSG